MSAAAPLPVLDTSRPIDLAGADFTDHKYAWYRFLLDEAPVCTGRISLLRIHLVARYEDCRLVLTDPRFLGPASQYVPTRT